MRRKRKWRRAPKQILRCEIARPMQGFSQILNKAIGQISDFFRRLAITFVDFANQALCAFIG